MEKLLSLKNIGRTSAHWLSVIGINSYDDLNNLGAVEAYKLIENRGIRTSKVLLYALQGALLDQHWNEIPESLKDELCKKAGIN